MKFYSLAKNEWEEKNFLNKTWKENHEKMLKYKENFRTRKKSVNFCKRIA